MSAYILYRPMLLGGGGGGGGITSINGDSSTTQLLTVGTAGTDFAIVDAGGGSHVFNLPTASASNRGALSSADWSTFNAKQPAGSYITALTGDGTAAGPGSAAFTLATVNSNVGSFGSSTAIPSFTVNGKGLITAASTNVVIAPAGTLSGTTLNSTVVSSSLTSVGTITTGVWQGTAVAIGFGGTGQTSKAAAFDALSPMTTGGDLIYGGTSGTGTRLANGSAGQFLISNGGTAAPSWSTTLGVANGGTGTTTAFTTGSVVFAGTSGVYSQNNGQFFWDNTNFSLMAAGASTTVSSNLTNTVGFSQALLVGQSGSSFQQTIVQNGANSNASTIGFVKTRSASGNTTFATTVNSGDQVMSLISYGSNSAAYAPLAQIRTEVDGTPSTSSMPGRILFFTTPSGSNTLAEAMRVDSGQSVLIGTTSSTVNGSTNQFVVSSANVGGVIRANIVNTDTSNVNSQTLFGVRCGTTALNLICSNSGSADFLTSSNAGGFILRASDAAGTLRFQSGGTTTRLTIGSAGDLLPNNIHNNGGTAGSATQAIASGTYTPTVTNVSGVSNISSTGGQWLRVGNVVTVSGEVDLSVATGSSSATIGLPTTTANFSSVSQLAGFISTTANPAANLGVIRRTSGAQTADLVWTATATTSNQTYYYQFTYSVQ